MPVNGSVRATITFEQKKTSGLASTVNTLSQSPSITLNPGTAANQCDVLWSDSRVLNATSELLDLVGVLTDAFGATVNAGRVKTLYVRNTSTVDAAVLTLGGATTNAWASPFGDPTDKIKVPAGGFIILTAPLATAFPVTAGSADMLKVDAGSANITYEIGIVAASV